MSAGITAVVPAAGRAERFGGGKLLADIRGEPLLTHTIRSLLDGGVGAVIVVTPGLAAFDGVPLLDDARVSVVVNPDPARGMFSSIQCGLSGRNAAGLVMVLPADMPFVQPVTIATVAARAARAGVLVVPVHEGRRGHPIAIPGDVGGRLLTVSSTASLKQALAAVVTTRIELAVEDAGILRDVDVPGDLQE